MKPPQFASAEPDGGLREPALDMWAHAIDAFPMCGSAGEKLQALVRYAILAPSSHNSQPWRFRSAGESLELWADPSRSLPATDPANRELVISCGAALGCLEIALHHFGYAGEIPLLPNPASPDLLARVTLGAIREPTQRDHRLFEAMLKRQTNRQPFLPTPLESGLLDDLEQIAQDHGLEFRILQSESSRQTLALLITEGDRSQMADPSFRGELAAWMHPNRTRSHDGMPGWTFGLGEIESWVAPLVVRTFDMGSGRAAHDEELAQGSPVLAVLSAPVDSRHDWIETGRTLSHLLARAGMDGVAASYLNQPIEIPSLRYKVEALLGCTCAPQLILRLGYPQREDRRTPRRPVSDVLSTREDGG